MLALPSIAVLKVPVIRVTSVFMLEGVFYDVEVLWEGVTVVRLLECCATCFDLILDFTLIL